jgi:hypothetical protein
MQARRKNRARTALAGSLLIVCAAAGALADDFWRKKPFHEWTAEEAVKLLRDSPWARQQVMASAQVGNAAEASISAGTANCDPDAIDPNGNCLERKVSLPRDPSQMPGVTFSESNYGVYLVRWESALPVEQAFARLGELGERPTIAYLSAPPRLPADRYVITVKVLRPPRGASDLLAERADSHAKPRVWLKTSHGTSVPLETERTGAGANAAVHFFFPREQKGRPILASPHDTAEFIFEGQHVTLKVKFSLDSKT